MKRLNGAIVYDGPSQIDGQPIVVIITGFTRTENVKTGNMLSSWILLKDIPPCDAANQNQDISICGQCKHRIWGTCYVNLGHGPYNVYNAYKRGSYKQINYNRLNGRTLRIGSYGDPVAVPYDVWINIIMHTRGVTGYTHQWRNCDMRISEFCMASVDTPAEAIQSKALGWRTFRIIQKGDNLFNDEYICPADKSNETKTTCDRCLACCGYMHDFKKSPVIFLHGLSYKVSRYKRIMKLRHNKRRFSHLLPIREVPALF